MTDRYFDQNYPQTLNLDVEGYSRDSSWVVQRSGTKSPVWAVHYIISKSKATIKQKGTVYEPLALSRFTSGHAWRSRQELFAAVKDRWSPFKTASSDPVKRI